MPRGVDCFLLLFYELFWRRFEDLLRSLTVERKDICGAMIFALDNADSAFEVLPWHDTLSAMTCSNQLYKLHCCTLPGVYQRCGSRRATYQICIDGDVHDHVAQIRASRL